MLQNSPGGTWHNRWQWRDSLEVWSAGEVARSPPLWQRFPPFRDIIVWSSHKIGIEKPTKNLSMIGQVIVNKQAHQLMTWAPTHGGRHSKRHWLAIPQGPGLRSKLFTYIFGILAIFAHNIIYATISRHHINTIHIHIAWIGIQPGWQDYLIGKGSWHHLSQGMLRLEECQRNLWGEVRGEADVANHNSRRPRIWGERVQCIWLTRYDH